MSGIGQTASADNRTWAALTEHLREIQKLASIQATLEWDQQTYLPAAGGRYRADQIAYLAGRIHQMKTDPRYGEWLAELEANTTSGPAPDDANAEHGARPAILRELRRQYDKDTRLPEDLVTETAECGAVGQQVWVAARKADDFEQFAPYLRQMFELKRREADAIGYDDRPYDVLLDDYEPGMRTSQVAGVLDGLKTALVPLVRAIAEADQRPNTAFLSREFPVERQKEFVEKASARIGFDFQRGRLDVTHHPFCTELGPHDVRITTRYEPHHFNTAFFGVLHESGHGMYEQGLPTDDYGLPTGTHCSLGIHESQSRLWENLVGRSRGFWRYFFPQAQSYFPESLSGVDETEFYEAINDVRPSLIRVEADEATYNLHIVIRFELELALLEGDLTVEDLPTAWREKYRDHLGVEPDNDANGVLQDIHWSAGLIGYFPTYSLGNLYACQFFEQAQADLGPMEERFAQGSFSELLDWLRKRVHQVGRSCQPAELVKQITGGPIDHRPLIRYLSDKLLPIYGLSNS